jgi:hypothetical protein
MNIFPNLTLISSFLIAGLSQAATVNIDFQGGGTTVVMTGLAIAPDSEGASAQWNLANHAASGAALNFSDGSASGMTISLTNGFGSWTHQNGGDSGSNIGGNALLKDYGYDNAGASNLGFTIGLVPAGEYDLYVYGGLPFITSTQSLTSSVNVTGETSQDIVWAAALDAGTFQLGENYVVFQGITLATAGSITGSVTTATGEANLSGIQLVAVPEPSSVLLTLSGLALAFSLRRR